MAPFDLRVAEEMLTIPESAAALGTFYDRTDVWALIATGELHPVNVVSWRGTKTRIRRTEVQAYVRRRATATRARLANRPAAVRISFATHHVDAA